MGSETRWLPWFRHGLVTRMRFWLGQGYFVTVRYTNGFIQSLHFVFVRRKLLWCPFVLPKRDSSWPVRFVLINVTNATLRALAQNTNLDFISNVSQLLLKYRKLLLSHFRTAPLWLHFERFRAAFVPEKLSDSRPAILTRSGLLN